MTNDGNILVIDIVLADNAGTLNNCCIFKQGGVNGETSIQDKEELLKFLDTKKYSGAELIGIQNRYLNGKLFRHSIKEYTVKYVNMFEDGVIEVVYKSQVL
jgi:hypothetical protein